LQQKKILRELFFSRNLSIFSSQGRLPLALPQFPHFETIPPKVQELLQEFDDVFPKEIPPGLPPLRGIKYQIDLVPRASLPNRPAYRNNPQD